MSHRPNIIYIMADDMGYGDLGCYGATQIRTPAVDSIAENGVRFTDAHSASAVCTPSRYAVLTGRYCWRTRLEQGVLGGFGAPLIEQERMTLPELLRRAGYTTAAIGKWHLGFEWPTKDGGRLSDHDHVGWHFDGFDVDYEQSLAGGPLDVGFDSFFGISGSLDMPPYCFIEDDHTVGVPSLEKAPYNPQQRRGLMVPGWRDDVVDVTFAERAVEFITNHAEKGGDEPFFLYLTPSAPHRPCLPPGFMRGKSDAGLRGDMVMTVDWIVGRVLETVRHLSIVDSTLIVLTSDNGGRLTDINGIDHGHKVNGDLRGQKADIHDGGHREPLVAMWPGHIAPGTTCHDLVCLSDIMATCGEIAGTPVPENAAEDSFSFLSLLTGVESAAPRRQDVVHHSLDGMFSLRRGPWKLIDGLGSGGFSEPRRYPQESEGPPGQLYHMEHDSRETLNRWQRDPETVKKLQELLHTYREAGRSRT
jgi:arylsulfatase A